MAKFGKLFRFKNVNGDIFYGEAQGLETITKDVLVGSTVPVYNTTSLWDSAFELSTQEETVAEVNKLFFQLWAETLIDICDTQVLAPLETVPIFFCVGLNYKQHAVEANVSIKTCTPVGNVDLLILRHRRCNQAHILDIL